MIDRDGLASDWVLVAVVLFLAALLAAAVVRVPGDCEAVSRVSLNLCDCMEAAS